MSKQVGLIKLEGTIGGIAFYQSNGQHLARIANGPSKQQIATSPSFVRTRENNSEFGAAAQTAKSFRNAFASSVQTMKDSRITARLTRLCRGICDKDTAGTRGQRAIMLQANAVMIRGFEFNKLRSFGSVFHAPFTFSHDVSREKIIADIQNLVAPSFIHAPAGATHFRMIMAVGTVADYQYDKNSNSYDPADPAQDGRGEVTDSGILALSDPNPQNITLVVNMPFPPAAGVCVIQALGIEFYQEVGGNNYLFAQGNAMRVIDAF